MKPNYITRLALVVIFSLFQLAAQPQGPGGRNMPPGEGIAGTVSSVAKDSLTVTPFSGGDSVTIKVSDSTRLMKDRQPSKLSEIKAGDTVFVRGNLKGSVMEAFMVGVIPPEMVERFKEGNGRGFPGRGGPGQQAFNAQAFNPEDMGKKFIAGEVKAINETHLTITRPDGQSQDIEVDENTSFKRGNESITLADIKVGDFVRGQGELKNNVFTPKELRVGRPRIQMRSGDRVSPSATQPSADQKPAPAPPN